MARAGRGVPNRVGLYRTAAPDQTIAPRFEFVVDTVMATWFIRSVSGAWSACP